MGGFLSKGNSSASPPQLECTPQTLDRLPDLAPAGTHGFGEKLRQPHLQTLPSPSERLEELSATICYVPASYTERLKTDPLKRDKCSLSLAEQLNLPSALPYLVYGEPWPSSKTITRTNSHLRNDFESALANVIRGTGRTPDRDEQAYLRFLLQYPEGWSATDVDHMDHPAFRYIYQRWPHLDLYPVLDDVTWPEEEPYLPQMVAAHDACFFLLATPENYYIYQYADNDLFNAGSTLEDVYWGVRHKRHCCAHNGGVPWPTEPAVGPECCEGDNGFPVYMGLW
jgi:hypothetical protein